MWQLWSATTTNFLGTGDDELAECLVLRPVDAVMEPWCLVELFDGTYVLFGYALTHSVTRGLAWTRSTEVLELDRERGRAATGSGRRYRLGREFAPLDVRVEGEEARVAFELLLGDVAETMDALREFDRSWLSACKAARHLGVQVPARTVAAVEAFTASFLQRYMALRRK